MIPPNIKFSSFPIAHLPRAFPLPFLRADGASNYFPSHLLLNIMSVVNAGFPRGNCRFKSFAMPLVPPSMGRPCELVNFVFHHRATLWSICGGFLGPSAFLEGKRPAKNSSKASKLFYCSRSSCDDTTDVQYFKYFDTLP
jgi:hypothetical protein